MLNFASRGAINWYLTFILFLVQFGKLLLTQTSGIFKMVRTHIIFLPTWPQFLFSFFTDQLIISKVKAVMFGNHHMLVSNRKGNIYNCGQLLISCLFPLWCVLTCVERQCLWGRELQHWLGYRRWTRNSKYSLAFFLFKVNKSWWTSYCRWWRGNCYRFIAEVVSYLVAPPKLLSSGWIAVYIKTKFVWS